MRCAIPAATLGICLRNLRYPEGTRLERRSWSQVVAVTSGLPANVVAVWSQSGVLTESSDPAIGPLSCGDGGAPRGIRTPNRQIRSLVTFGSRATPLDKAPFQYMESSSTLGSAARAGGHLCPGYGAATRVVGVSTSSKPGA